MCGSHESHVIHVISFSVGFNSNLDRGSTGRTIEFNWEINCSNRIFFFFWVGEGGGVTHCKSS